MYVDILNGLIFDAVCGSWILSPLLYTVGLMLWHKFLRSFLVNVKTIIFCFVINTHPPLCHEC